MPLSFDISHSNFSFCPFYHGDDFIEFDIFHADFSFSPFHRDDDFIEETN